jgi:hypothetical protein
MNNTTGYIYFYIKSENENHTLDFFNRYLTLKPTNFSQIGDKGNRPICTSWEFSSGELTSPIYHLEVTKLVKILNVHKEEFLKLKNKNKDIQMVLQVVIYLKEDSPQLYFNEEVIVFVHYLGADIDCDIFNNK